MEPAATIPATAKATSATGGNAASMRGDREAESGAFPTAIWLAFSLGALSLSVFRIPLSARYLPNGERLAIYFVLGMQILLSAGGLAFFLRSWRSTAGILFGSWPVI